MAHKKPTGAVFSLRLPAAEGTAISKIQFPEQKTDVERLIVDRVISACVEKTYDPYSLKGAPRQEPESSFDFSLSTTSGPAYLELIELAPLGNGSTYATLPHAYRVGEFAYWIYGKINSKAVHYQLHRSVSIVHLLLYSTDSRFHVKAAVVDLVTHYCQVRPPGFSTIHWFSLDSATEGQVAVIWPRHPRELDAFAYRSAENTVVLLGNMGLSTPSGENSVTVPLGSPKELIRFR